MKKQTGQLAFAKLLFAMREKKDEIQAELNGKLTVTELAARYEMPVFTTKSALKAIGINFGRVAKRAIRSHQEGGSCAALLIVVARIAEGLAVPHDEIKPFLVK